MLTKYYLPLNVYKDSKGENLRVYVVSILTEKPIRSNLDGLFCVQAPSQKCLVRLKATEKPNKLETRTKAPTCGYLIKRLYGFVDKSVDESGLRIAPSSLPIAEATSVVRLGKA